MHPLAARVRSGEGRIRGPGLLDPTFPSSEGRRPGTAVPVPESTSCSTPSHAPEGCPPSSLRPSGPDIEARYRALTGQRAGAILLARLAPTEPLFQDAVAELQRLGVWPGSTELRPVSSVADPAPAPGGRRASRRERAPGPARQSTSKLPPLRAGPAAAGDRLLRRGGSRLPDPVPPHGRDRADVAHRLDRFELEAPRNDGVAPASGSGVREGPVHPTRQFGTDRSRPLSAAPAGPMVGGHGVPDPRRAAGPVLRPPRVRTPALHRVPHPAGAPRPGRAGWRWRPRWRIAGPGSSP